MFWLSHRQSFQDASCWRHKKKWWVVNVPKADLDQPNELMKRKRFSYFKINNCPKRDFLILRYCRLPTRFEIKVGEPSFLPTDFL